jgi:uncharacterized low-complexity protein
MSAAAFCRQHQVPESSFYNWKRKLKQRRREDESKREDQATSPGITLSGAARKQHSSRVAVDDWASEVCRVCGSASTDCGLGKIGHGKIARQSNRSGEWSQATTSQLVLTNSANGRPP